MTILKYKNKDVVIQENSNNEWHMNLPILYFENMERISHISKDILSTPLINDLYRANNRHNHYKHLRQ